MKATGHAISWIYGEFKIARFVRGKLVEQFAPDYLVETPTDFVRALREAKKHISLKGKGNVSIVHEHDLHVHSFMNIPAMRKRDLEKYLQRKVDQEKSSESEIAWCYHEAKHKEGDDGILLHMLPKRIVDTTTATCIAMGLVPNKYVPLTEIVSAYLPTLGYENNDVILVVALFSERTEIVVGSGEGEVFFVRELGFGTHSGLEERLGLDISRTARYTKQQTGKIIHEVIIIGSRPENILESLGDVANIDIRLDETSNDPNFWIHQTALLPARLSANFISALAQRNITKESAKHAGVWLTFSLLAITSIVTTTSAHTKSQRTDKLLESNRIDAQLDSELSELRERVSLSQEKIDRLQAMRSNSMNMPSIFLLHLSSLTPESVVLKNVTIKNMSSTWAVSIQGMTHDDVADVPRILESFEVSLKSSPWNMTIDESWRKSWMDQFRTGSLIQQQSTFFNIAGVLR